MATAYPFYTEVLRRLLAQGSITPNSRILVVAAGMGDRDVLRDSGFSNVILSNLNGEMDVAHDTTFQWIKEDAENLSRGDSEFDWVIEHNGIHHCASPHRALLEMLRVAKRGVLFFEPYDNLITRLGVRLGIGQEFEHAAVYYSGGSRLGGVRNSEIPNYVYRWTRREIEKTVMSHSPYAPHHFQFIHKMVLPWDQLRGRRNKLPYYAALAVRPFISLVQLLTPTQSNHFATVILKPDLKRELYPWLTLTNQGQPTINSEWLAARYQPASPDSH